MKQRIAVLVLLLSALPALGQGYCKSDVVQNRNGNAVPQSQIYICTPLGTGTPCTPQVPIYSDPGLTSLITQPMTADNLGKFAFCTATAGRYQQQIFFAGAWTTDTKYVVPAGDTVPGVFVSSSFADDGATSGVAALITVPRLATLTAVHLRAVFPWMACTTSPILYIYGRSQNAGETDHLYATLTIQGAIHPAGQTSQHYFANADLTGLNVAVAAGDELKLFWKPAATCSQYGSGIVVSINYEGSR